MFFEKKSGIINLIFDIILGRLWGILGIYVATLIARVCTNLWYEPYAVYRYGLKKSPLLYFKRYCIYIAVIFVGGGLSWIVCSMCSFSIMWNAIAKLIICTIIPNAVFVIAFRKTEEFAYLKGSAERIARKVLLK